LFSALRERLEPLVPRPHRHRHDEVARQARVTIWLTAGAVPLLVLAATISVAVRGPNHLAAILAVTAALALLTPVVLRAGASAGISWLLGSVLVGVSLVAWAGYGPMSPVVATFVLFPVVGLVIGGQRIGTLFTIATVAQIVALLGSYQLGHRFPLVPEGPTFVLVHTLVVAHAVVIVFLFLNAYEAAWRQAAAEAEAHADELRKAAEAKQAFLAQMSHELRTPLNAVIGYTELVLEDVGAPHATDLQRVHQAGSHLRQLVDELLNLEKIASGQLHLTAHPVDLHELVDVLLHQVRPRAAAGVALRNEVPAGLEVVSDALRIRQVLANLVANAVTFTPDGHVAVIGERDGDGVRIDVRDTGVGMAPEEVATIFEPFRQGAAGKHQGTGLGLAISNSLAKALGGRLHATSEQGVGTTFTLHLPWAVPRRATEPSGAAPER